MGTIAAFKAHYYKLDRSTIQLKLNAVQQAWNTVSNETIRNIFINCGIVGEESLDSIRRRFMKEVEGSIPIGLEEEANFYELWVAGSIEVEGAHRGRGIKLALPTQLHEGHLDGSYWCNFGRKIK